MAPPTWPAELLQSLARYVFSSNNTLCVGDHVSWHAPLAPHHQGSHICHMLLAPDPQLHGNHQTSSLGTLHFIQVVGITSEELAAAQKWNGLGLLRLMRSCDPYVCVYVCVSMVTPSLVCIIGVVENCW